jgi:hypothetical protein
VGTEKHNHNYTDSFRYRVAQGQPSLEALELTPALEDFHELGNS